MTIPGRDGSSSRGGPRALSDVLSDLFAARGLGRLQARADLESAWIKAVGEQGGKWTRVDSLTNGVLTVTVAHPTLLEELRSFQKASILQTLRQSLPDCPLNDIRFRVGSILTDAQQAASARPSSSKPATERGSATQRSATPGNRRTNARRTKPGSE